MASFCPQLVGSMSEGAAGNPTGVMMEAAFAHHGLDWRYVNMEVAAASLGAAVAGARAMGYRGFNCSIPHKVAVIAHLDGLAPSASIIGAVNCVVATAAPGSPNGEDRLTDRLTDRLMGHNTDGEGFVRSLAERRPIAGTRVVVLGAGGAARAIAVELALAGAADIHIVNRDVGRGTALASLITTHTAATATFEEWTDPVAIDPSTDVVVNGTSVGLYEPTAMPSIDPSTLRPSMLVADVVFNPVDTRFLQTAAAARCETLDGLGMLVNQGAAAIEYWTGLTPDRTVMRHALAAAMQAG